MTFGGTYFPRLLPTDHDDRAGLFDRRAHDRDGAQRATADDMEEVTGQNWTDNERSLTMLPGTTFHAVAERRGGKADRPDAAGQCRGHLYLGRESPVR